MTRICLTESGSRRHLTASKYESRPLFLLIPTLQTINGQPAAAVLGKE
ncbi:MAG: hypothetical protein ACK4RK_10325 [Gemmataceae bacterium]